MFWIFAWSLLGCGSPADGVPAEVPVPEVHSVESTISAERLVVDVLDRATLDSLESAGLTLSSLLGSPAPRESLAAAGARSAPAALFQALSASIEASIGDIPDRDLVFEHADAIKYPAGNVGRTVDVRWLSSPYAEFRLIGVVSRVDRRDFAGGCGETRVLYRLSYQFPEDQGGSSSRLPFLLNVVLQNPGSDCRAIARRWMDPPTAGPERAKWVQERLLSGTTLKQVEVNAQIVRFPAGFDTEFGGQALYLLQVFEPTSEGFRAKPLENTPDVARLLRDEGARAELTGWISANLDGIDRGVYQIPETLLATKALSWSTLGVNRAANKPFAALYPEERWQELPDPRSDARKFLGGRRSLVERLDNGSCTGCHQSGTMAGFQVLGEEDPAIDGVTNRLALARSPHAMRERERRLAYAEALVNGRSPEVFRPHSLGEATASADHACVPEAFRSELANGAAWGCAAPSVCRIVVQDAKIALPFGQCVISPEAPDSLTAGRTCREGVVSSRKPESDPFNAHAYKDKFAHAQLYGLPEDQRMDAEHFNCRPPLIGVPLGRAYRGCTDQERTLEGVLRAEGSIAPEMCAVVGGSKFDKCVEGNFHECMEGIVGRGMVDTCHPGRTCREDYSCQAVPAELPGMPPVAADLAKSGVGFCTPTYFLFQLRLDGHPVPK